MTYFVRGYGQTCKVAWQAIYGIAHSRLEETVKAFLDGVVTFDRGSRPNSQRHKTNVAKAWMTLFFIRIGDKMPDTLAINLPSYLDHRIIYGYLTDDLKKKMNK